MSTASEILEPCPVCGDPVKRPIVRDMNVQVSCSNCGNFQLTSTARAILEGSNYDERKKAVLAHAIRRQGDSVQGGSVHVTSQFMENAVDANLLPGAMERLDNLIHHLANRAEPGEPVTLYASRLRAVIGAASTKQATWALNEVHEMNYVRGKADDAHRDLLDKAVLTASGWQRYEELMKNGAGSRHAFMAMKFNDPQLDDLFAAHFKPAVKQAGFDLRKLDESPTAGLIDNRMRVEIRTSRFLVCDLSHGNKGAYWEAGFAEGLGRPVIYLCRDDVFTDGHEHRPHFDTNHHAIIKWNANDPSVAAASLKDMIRATLPGEAAMTDPA